MTRFVKWGRTPSQTHQFMSHWVELHREPVDHIDYTSQYDQITDLSLDHLTNQLTTSDIWPCRDYLSVITCRLLSKGNEKAVRWIALWNRIVSRYHGTRWLGSLWLRRNSVAWVRPASTLEVRLASTLEVRLASTLEVRLASTLEVRLASTLAGETLSAAPGIRYRCLGEADARYLKLTHGTRS